MDVLTEGREHERDSLAAIACACAIWFVIGVVVGITLVRMGWL